MKILIYWIILTQLVPPPLVPKTQFSSKTKENSHFNYFFPLNGGCRKLLHVVLYKHMSKEKLNSESFWIEDDDLDIFGKHWKYQLSHFT